MANKTEYLPASVKTKIYKTGQTRGADDDVIYQNRPSIGGKMERIIELLSGKYSGFISKKNTVNEIV